MPPPINIFVKVILKVKDKNKNKLLMPLADTEGHSQENPNTEQMIGIWTQTLSKANTPYSRYTAEVFLCCYYRSFYLNVIMHIHCQISKQ